jgi:hypothetical protein
VTTLDWLSSFANIAEIVTAIVAAAAALNVLTRRHRRRVRLEEYLKRVRNENGGHGGIRNIVHLMGNCSMTEAQVLEAAFSSRKIKSWVAKDGEDGPDAALMFQYDEHAKRPRHPNRGKKSK